MRTAVAAAGTADPRAALSAPQPLTAHKRESRPGCYRCFASCIGIFVSVEPLSRSSRSYISIIQHRACWPASISQSMRPCLPLLFSMSDGIPATRRRGLRWHRVPILLPSQHSNCRTQISACRYAAPTRVSVDSMLNLVHAAVLNLDKTPHFTFCTCPRCVWITSSNVVCQQPANYKQCRGSLTSALLMCGSHSPPVLVRQRRLLACHAVGRVPRGARRALEVRPSTGGAFARNHWRWGRAAACHPGRRHQARFLYILVTGCFCAGSHHLQRSHRSAVQTK